MEIIMLISFHKILIRGALYLKFSIRFNRLTIATSAKFACNPKISKLDQVGQFISPENNNT